MKRKTNPIKGSRFARWSEVSGKATAVLRRVAVPLLALAAICVGAGCGNGQKRCAPNQSSPSCSGPPTVDACFEADGCTIGPTCVPIYCRGIETMLDCSAHSLCKWAGDPAHCGQASTENPCADSTEQVCKTNNNCIWQLTCNGQLKDCYGVSETECAAIPHCYVETVPNF